VRRTLNCAREVREKKLVTQNAGVDAERKLLDPLGYGEGRVRGWDCSWRRGALGGGHQSPAGSDTLRGWAGDPCVLACVETARLVRLFDAMRGWGSAGVMPGIFCVCFGCPEWSRGRDGDDRGMN